MTEPLAITIYRRHQQGESLARIAAALALPLAAVRARLRHAIRHHNGE